MTAGGLTARRMVWHPVEDVALHAVRAVKKEGATTVVSFFPPAPLASGRQA